MNPSKNAGTARNDRAHSGIASQRGSIRTWLTRSPEFRGRSTTAVTTASKMSTSAAPLSSTGPSGM